MTLVNLCNVTPRRVPHVNLVLGIGHVYNTVPFTEIIVGSSIVNWCFLRYRPNFLEAEAGHRHPVSFNASPVSSKRIPRTLRELVILIRSIETAFA